ncbi:RNA polymerase sigma factor [Kitasatospora sp. SUK 42]|uniref:RNA polymerase sigma factor n=1 Tax=Kitasatospora sp. SUK 42 TaxID=1588882 RepID=UPI001C31B013|nr:sigma-70 family RNA polymerase sigma factor [Kitasatospora sp. SUK 42]MBV2156459.1 sigma-70 family RNA polymerase sigma factor [Kitasatospora sp. SUK 42]
MAKSEGAGAHGSSPSAPMSEAHLEELVRDLLPRLVTSLREMTHDEQTAENIAARTCMVVINEVRKGTVFHRPVIAYATTVARRMAIDHWRSAAARREEPVAEIPEGSRPATARDPGPDDPGARLEFEELLRIVHKAIGDQRQARIWELHHIWLWKGTEIAETLGISASTVSRELKRANERARTAPVPLPRREAD